MVITIISFYFIPLQFHVDTPVSETWIMFVLRYEACQFTGSGRPIIWPLISIHIALVNTIPNIIEYHHTGRHETPECFSAISTSQKNIIINGSFHESLVSPPLSCGHFTRSSFHACSVDRSAKFVRTRRFWRRHIINEQWIISNS